ncbi:hypothetical protein [Flavobacterium lacisediminis]|uniref:GLPGLI family protein n=1 Tax=Flavobacterium lacisediminis TaxID=2989705 RepID=A0ABT3EF20_9FLAO|nr:hypothetical protein [Flavobacterium lacisediminis]MCW1147157.1 hypothetical protein [Flavobacterium lacisediminis]
MKNVLIIYILLTCFEFSYSQKLEEKIIINKTSINKLAKEEFEKCYEYYKNNPDTLNNSQETIYTVSKKVDLELLPIPIFNTKKSDNTKNFIESIDFENYDSQIVFVLNKEKYIISDFIPITDCYFPFYIKENLRVSVLGAMRMIFSVYDFDLNSFYFFTDTCSNGMFEIVNNKVYYITPIIDDQTFKDENIDADLKVVKDKKIVKFVKIECDIFSEKFIKSEVFRYYFRSEEELRKQITKPKNDIRLNFQFK